MFSRPCRVLRTSPALSITRRCFVTACRVIADPVVSLVIDKRPSSDSLAANRSRVRSPSAAKTVAVALSLGVLPRALRRMSQERPEEVVPHHSRTFAGGEPAVRRTSIQSSADTRMARMHHARHHRGEAEGKRDVAPVPGCDAAAMRRSDVSARNRPPEPTADFGASVVRCLARPRDRT